MCCFKCLCAARASFRMQEVHRIWALEKAMEQKNQTSRQKSDIRVGANCPYSTAHAPHGVLALLGQQQAAFPSMMWSMFLKTLWMALQASSARQAEKQAFTPYYQRALWGLERCWVDNFALEKPWTPQLTGPKALQHRARRVSCRRCNPREWVAGEVRTATLLSRPVQLTHGVCSEGGNCSAAGGGGGGGGGGGVISSPAILLRLDYDFLYVSQIVYEEDTEKHRAAMTYMHRSIEGIGPSLVLPEPPSRPRPRTASAIPVSRREAPLRPSNSSVQQQPQQQHSARSPPVTWPSQQHQTRLLSAPAARSTAASSLSRDGGFRGSAGPRVESLHTAQYPPRTTNR